MSTSGGPDSSAGGNQHLGGGASTQTNLQNSAEVLIQRDASKEINDLLKKKLKLDGDYLDNLKDSVKEMQKSLRVYDQINAKIDAYSATEINTKKVKQEIFKNDVNRNINLIKLNSLSKNLSDIEKQGASDYLNLIDQKQKAEDELRKTAKSGTDDQIRSAKERINIIEQELDNKLQSLNVEQASYVQALKSDELYKKSSERLAERVVFEKKSEKHLGVLGHLLQITATKAGLGNDVFEEMVAKSKQLILQQEEEQKLAQENVDVYNKQFEVIKNMKAFLKKAKDSGASQGELDMLERSLQSTKNTLKFIQKDNLIGWSATGVAAKAALKGIVKSITDPIKSIPKNVKNVWTNIETSATNVFDLIKRGPNWAAMMSGGMSSMKIGWKVLGAGVSAFFTSIKEKMKSDPLLKYGLIVGGIAYAFKGLGKAADFVGNMAGKAGNALAGMSEDSGNNVRNLTSGVSGLIKNIPLVGGLLGGVIDGFSAVLDLILGVNDAIVKTGRTLNLSSQEAVNLNRHYQDVSFNSGNLAMNSKDYLKTLVSITDALGTINQVSDATLETSYMLNKYAGIEMDTLAEIEKVAKVNGMTQKGVATSVFAQVEGLKNATGIQFSQQKILKEVAGSTGYIGLQFTKYPAKLTQSLLTVKSLGLELKDVEGIADSMLDFESSIAKEFEAQLITGKNINLSKVRQLALDNDLAGVALEINKQVGSSADFMKMNRIAQESFASAVGMSRDSLAEMLRKQEYLSKLGAKDTDNAREQLAIGLKKYKNAEALKAALGEEAYINLVNMSTQEKIAEFIDKIKQSVVDFIERGKVIEKIEKFVKMLENPDTIRGILGTIKNAVAFFMETIGEVLASVIEVGGQIKNLFTLGAKGDADEAAAFAMAARVRSGTKAIANNINSVGNTIGLGDTVAANAVGANGTTQTQAKDAQPVQNIIQVSTENKFVDGKWFTTAVINDGSGKIDKSAMNQNTK